MMRSFQEWLSLREASAQTPKARHAPQAIQAIHKHSKASSAAVSKLHRAIKTAAHVRHPAPTRNLGLDKWLQEVGGLKDVLAKLGAAVTDEKKRSDAAATKARSDQQKKKPGDDKPKDKDDKPDPKDAEEDDKDDADDEAPTDERDDQNGGEDDRQQDKAKPHSTPRRGRV